MNFNLKSGLFALLGSAMLAGCSLTTAPSELVKPPQLEINQQEMKQAVEEFLPEGAKLTIPLRPQQSNAIKQLDLDSDGANELVAFYHKEQDSKLGAIVLKKAGEHWKPRGNIEELAREIDYAGFHDVTGDKKPEILVGWSGGNSLGKDLAVYAYQKTKLEELAKTIYRDLSIEDLNGDGTKDIAVIYRDNNKELPTSVIQLYEYRSGQLQKTQQKEYDGYPEQVTIGNATAEKRGIFIDFGLGAHSAYTQLAVLENGQLENVFEDDAKNTPSTFKAYPLPCTDINDDGIVEIGIQQQPPGTEKLAMVEIPWVNTWHQWDGKTGLNPVLRDYAD